MSLVHFIHHPSKDQSVVLQDDDRVAYAYLVDRITVVSFVWLYNVSLPPAFPSSLDGPPHNSAPHYTGAQSLPRLTATSAVHCRWGVDGVSIDVDSAPWARLKFGARPGWSILVEVPGPLGLPLASAP